MLFYVISQSIFQFLVWTTAKFLKQHVKTWMDYVKRAKFAMAKLAAI